MSMRTPLNVARVSNLLSRPGDGERDCLSKAKARPAEPSERERVSQSPISNRRSVRQRQLRRAFFRDEFFLVTHSDNDPFRERSNRKSSLRSSRLRGEK